MILAHRNGHLRQPTVNLFDDHAGIGAELDQTVGDRWLTPEYFRFGASSLLNDLCMQLARRQTGLYQRPEDFSRD